MNIDQVIGKLMGDGSIGEERSALDAWKKEAEENAKALVEMQKIAALSSTLNGYQDFNADNAWDAFSDNIEDEKVTVQQSSDPTVISKTDKTSIFSLRNLARVAAIAIAVIGSLFLINSLLNPTNNEVKPKTYSSALENMNFDLADGTHVTLDKNSDLKVLDDRDVALTGRAHFDVQRNESKQFTISLPVGSVTVLGTEFTIDADDKTTEVYVVEGSVRYELDNRTYTLVAGDLVSVTNNVVSKLKARDDNINSWKSQTLIFRDDNMTEVVAALSKHFKEQIEIENPKDFANCNVVNVFKNSTLVEILNGLSKTHGLKFELREGKYYLVAAKC